MTLENALRDSEQAAKKVSLAAARLVQAVKQLEKAAASGDLSILRDARVRVQEAVRDAARDAEDEAGRWPWSESEEEEFLRSEYMAELKAAADGLGIPFNPYGESWSAYPVLVRVEPKTKSIRLDRRRVRALRPSVLVRQIQKVRQAKPRQTSEQFLEILYSGYLAALGGQALIDRGYRIIRPQYPVGRYRIDFVIEGPHSRLALECDGDRFHGPDQWDADRARQEVLERAGWTFVRIRGSGFYRNPTQALQPLWEKLDELDIPTGDWRGHPVPFDLDLDLQNSASKTNKTPTVTVPDDGEAALTQVRAPSIVSTTNPHADAWGPAFSAADEALRRRSKSTDKVDDHSAD